jgi:putative membrane protein
MYHYLLALHLIAVICWFAGLFYLPRLFVYHAMTTDTNTAKTFCTMEYKLNYYIMHPSMAVTLITGYVLYYAFPHAGWGDWIHVKLILVWLLVGYQMWCGYYLRQFRANINKKSHRFFRLFNEIPTVFLIVIVILAVVKPF